MGSHCWWSPNAGRASRKASVALSSCSSSRTEHLEAQNIPLLVHLTETIDPLASIFGVGRLNNLGPRGDVSWPSGNPEAQRLLKLSEAVGSAMADVAIRDGHFGVGFSRPWAEQNGAMPVWSSPAGSQFRARLEVAEWLRFREDPELNDVLAELDQFTSSSMSLDAETRSSWWKEWAWRARGEFAFEPDEVAEIFAPSNSHDVVREMWLWEALDADERTMPPLVDPTWPIYRRLQVIGRGPAKKVSEVDENGNSKSGTWSQK